MIRLERERRVRVNGAELWSAATGSGTPLLMFNGGPGCDDYLGPVAALLSARCEVVRFEPRGCGRSSWDGRYDFETLVHDAEALRLDYGFERWIVAGHSAGPNAALAYALRYPARAVGLIGIAGGKIVDDRSWSEIYHARRAEAAEDQGGQTFHSDPEVNRVGNATFRAYCRRPSLLREIAELELPSVFINAELDIRPNWPTRQLAELIRGARYVEIVGAAHYVWLTHAAEARTRAGAGRVPHFGDRRTPTTNGAGMTR